MSVAPGESNVHSNFSSQKERVQNLCKNDAPSEHKTCFYSVFYHDNPTWFQRNTEFNHAMVQGAPNIARVLLNKRYA